MQYFFPESVHISSDSAHFTGEMVDISLEMGRSVHELANNAHFPGGVRGEEDYLWEFLL